MNPQLIAADEQFRAPRARLRAQDLRRVFALIRPYRGKLALGILASVGFAALQTASLSVVFPVFKILLEEEGVHGWAYRMVAGNRLGLELEPLSDREGITVARTHPSSSTQFAQRPQPGDRLTDPGRRPVEEFLQLLSTAPTGTPIQLEIETAGTRRSLEVMPSDPDLPLGILRRIVSLLPASAAQDKVRTLMYALLVMIAAAVTGNFLRYIGEITVAKAILRALMDLRERLYERTLQLPMAYFANKSTSDVVTRFVQDIQEIQRGLITLFGKAIREPLRAVCFLALALVLDWRIMVTMAVVAPFIVFIFWGVGRSVKKASRKLLQAYGVMIDALTASLHNLRVVKAYTAERYEQDRLEQVDHRMFKQQVKLARLDAMVGPIMETLGVFAGSVVAVWLAGRVLNHDLSPTKFMTLGVALSALLDPLRKITDVFVRIQRSMAGAERIFQVIDEPVEKELHPGGAEAKPLERGIEFLGVTFTYPGATTPALHDVSLTIQKGETLALVGPNGCGKTTLVSLLPRFFDPGLGEIRYDGVDLRSLTLTSLRRQIGLVSQEAIIFGGSPTENIAYGADALDPPAVEHAARRAYADEFIRNIPGGYAAKLGERGTTLSGGQRQRLTIARAIYRDAPVLIFDEATSQIDSESELKIQTAVREFARGRTTIIIAHRLSTIQFADRIIVMDAGRIVDSGAHAELYARCPLYRTLCETQLAGNAFVDRPR